MGRKFVKFSRIALLISFINVNVFCWDRCCSPMKVASRMLFSFTSCVKVTSALIHDQSPVRTKGKWVSRISRVRTKVSHQVGQAGIVGQARTKNVGYGSAAEHESPRLLWPCSHVTKRSVSKRKRKIVFNNTVRTRGTHL